MSISIPSSGSKSSSSSSSPNILLPYHFKNEDDSSSSSSLSSLPLLTSISPSPSHSSPSSSPPSSNSADLESLWSSYEKEISHIISSTPKDSIDIHPSPSFVIKCFHQVDEEKEKQKENLRRTNNNPNTIKTSVADNDQIVLSSSSSSSSSLLSRKLFLNICSDSNIPSPSTEMLPEDISPSKNDKNHSNNGDPNEDKEREQFRLPLSVGPLCEISDENDGGNSESTSIITTIDIVLSPLMVSKCMESKQMKMVVAEFCLQKVIEKYKLKICVPHSNNNSHSPDDISSFIKFPKLKYKGNLPPPSQSIRKNNQAKVKIVENNNITEKEKEKGEEKNREAKIQKIPMDEEKIDISSSSSPLISSISPSSSPSSSSSSFPSPSLSCFSSLSFPFIHSYISSDGILFTPTEWSSSFPSSPPEKIEISLSLPSALSLSDIDLSITESDVEITVVGDGNEDNDKENEGKREFLNGKMKIEWPFPVDEEGAKAKFVRKSHTLNIVGKVKPKEEDREGETDGKEKKKKAMGIELKNSLVFQLVF